MGLLKLFNVIAQQKLVPNASLQRSAFKLPGFVSGDVLTIEYQALAGVGADWEIISTATYSPLIGIFKADGTQLAYQNAFTIDAVRDLYVGTLSLSDAAFTSAVSAATPSSPYKAYLQISVLDSSGNRITGLEPTEIDCYKTLLTSANVTIPPGDVAATQAWVTNQFVNREDVSGIRTVKSRSGAKTFLHWVDDDGQPHYEEIP